MTAVRSVVLVRKMENEKSVVESHSSADTFRSSGDREKILVLIGLLLFLRINQNRLVR